MKMFRLLALIPVQVPLFDASRSNPDSNMHVKNPVERNTKKETPLLQIGPACPVLIGSSACPLRIMRFGVYCHKTPYFT